MVWWKYNHNIHHVATNSVEHDVDLHIMPVVATATDMYNSYWNASSAGAQADADASTGTTKKVRKDNNNNNNNVAAADKQNLTTRSSTPSSTTTDTTPTMIDRIGKAVSKFFVSYQHWTFFPIMFFYARINLHVKGYIHTIQQLLSQTVAAVAIARRNHNNSNNGVGGKTRGRGQLTDLLLDLGGCALYYVWLSKLLMTIPSWQERVVYVLIVHAVAGIIHIQICVNHFPMPCFDGTMGLMGGGPYSGSTKTGVDNNNATTTTTMNCNTNTTIPSDRFMNWPEMHLAGTTNVSCPTYMDWFHGGLQFQVEHHLWPRLPRHSLRLVKSRTMELCHRHNVQYSSRPFFDGVMYLHRHMVEVAHQVRQLPDNNNGPSFWDSITYKAACLDG
jgi:delta8-fatty-acid desaturase